MLGLHACFGGLMADGTVQTRVDCMSV